MVKTNSMMHGQKPAFDGSQMHRNTDHSQEKRQFEVLLSDPLDG